MKRRKLNLISLTAFALLGLALSGCATKVPKVPICAELSIDRAYCVNTITSEEFEWNEEKKFEGKTYWEARPTLLLLPASSWVEIKKFVIEVCKKTKKCDAEVTSWERTVQAIDQQIDQKQTSPVLP